MKTYIIEVEVDDSSEAAADNDFIRNEIVSELEDIEGVVSVCVTLDEDITGFLQC